MIVVHDFFGFSSGRIKTICKELSELNISVYQPDFFRGDSFNPFDKNNRPEDLNNFMNKFTLEKIDHDF